MRNWIKLIENLSTPDQLIDMDTAVTELYHNIDWSGGDGEGIHLEYCQDNNLDPDEDNKMNDEWFAEWAKTRIWDAWGNLMHTVKNGKMIVYRMITAPVDWKPDPNRHPGIYWSWEKNAAEAHNGSFSNDHVNWLITGEITTNEIDWMSTLVANATPTYDEEKEITLKENSPVTILEVTRA